MRAVPCSNGVWCAEAPTIEDGGQETEVTTTVGSRVLLRCDVIGQPRPEVTWLKDGAEVDSGRVERRSGALQLTAVTVNDSGLYECVASNEAGTARREVVLYVQGT